MMEKLDILNGFAGKVISDCIDITIEAIKRADKNRKSKNQTMETRIYQVIIDALNKFPYNEYKKREKVYDAAESMLKELKRSNGNYKESVRAGLKMLSSEITGNRCEDFLRVLCDEISSEENRDLAIVGIISQQGQIAKVMHEGFENNSRDHEETHKCLTYAIESIDSMREDMKRLKGDKEEHHERPKRNKVQDYADKWEENVFLNEMWVHSPPLGAQANFNRIEGRDTM